MGGSVFKISQYADDTAIITDGSETSIREVLITLNTFSSASGLTVNVEKSHIFPLGPFSYNNPDYFNTFHLNICTDSMSYLGISFTQHDEDFFRLNYKPKLSRIKSLLQSWLYRDITPIGRVILVKIFAISQLVYLFSVLPSRTSQPFY